MLPRYHLDLVRDTAEQAIYEESPNYQDAFACLAIGLLLLSVALLGARLGTGGASWHRVYATSFAGGFITCCLSLFYFVKSRIVFDRELQTLTIRRSLLGIP
jgi:hypothetical protein